MSTTLDEARKRVELVAREAAVKEAAFEQRVREIAREEIAKLSPAPVGEDVRRCFECGTVFSLTTVCPTCNPPATLDLMSHSAPTPPAKDTEGEAYFYAVSLFLHLAPQCEPLPDLIGVLTQIDNATTVIPDMRKQIADLEARLAEAEIRSGQGWAAKRVAEHALADATKRIEAAIERCHGVAAGVDDIYEVIDDLRALLSPAS